MSSSRVLDAVRAPAPTARPHIAAAGLLAGVLLAGVVGLFWWQDVRYSLPTPVPEDWHAVAPGAMVTLPPGLEQLRVAGGRRPLLLHFFNPACPCSRFNVDHVREIATTYADRVTVVAVLAEARPDDLRAAYRALKLRLPHYVDDDRSAATAVGAYSTPQAALIDAAGRLVYRGNYNTSRYCRDRETEFARIAIDDLLAGRAARPSPAAATVSYGCPLRGRTRAAGKEV